MIGINGIIITEKMHQAGLDIVSDMYDASIQKSCGGLDGYEHLDMARFSKNKDLIQKYLDYDIDSVQGVYLAMERAK